MDQDQNVLNASQTQEEKTIRTYSLNVSPGTGGSWGKMSARKENFAPVYTASVLCLGASL